MLFQTVDALTVNTNHNVTVCLGVDQSNRPKPEF